LWPDLEEMLLRGLIDFNLRRQGGRRTFSQLTRPHYPEPREGVLE